MISMKMIGWLFLMDKLHVSSMNPLMWKKINHSPVAGKAQLHITVEINGGDKDEEMDNDEEDNTAKIPCSHSSISSIGNTG